jgi:hypothetical protein
MVLTRAAANNRAAATDTAPVTTAKPKAAAQAAKKANDAERTRMEAIKKACVAAQRKGDHGAPPQADSAALARAEQSKALPDLDDLPIFTTHEPGIGERFITPREIRLRWEGSQAAQQRAASAYRGSWNRTFGGTISTAQLYF